MKCKIAMLFLPLLFLGFSNPVDKIRTDYYNNLYTLKDSRGPEALKLIMVDNMSRNRSQLVHGILFTYKNRKCTVVQVAGNFSNWEPVNMIRGKNGIWFHFLVSGDSGSREILKYKFNIDGIWACDPKNPQIEDDRIGSNISLFENPGNPGGSQVTFRILQKNLVEFRLFKPKARLISLVGDFNNWNPENDLLKRGQDGIWKLHKRLPAGIYLYKYIVDGKWVPDVYNSVSASDVTGEICSVIRIE